MSLASSLLLSVLAGSAPVQSSCQSYVGTIVKPIAFSEAVKGFANLKPKSEFETTAAYEVRRQAALPDLSGPIIVAKNPEDIKYFVYDADTQKLRILSYAFDNTGFLAWEAFYAAGLNDKIDSSTYSNIDVVISQNEKITGTYEATNGYGAKTQVTKIERSVEAIFDRKDSSITGYLFPQAQKSPYAVGELSLTPEIAQMLKPKLNLAFVVAPKEPYFVAGSTGVGKTTISNPTDITMKFSVMIADIQCGLLMDSDGKVLGGYATS